MYTPWWVTWGRPECLEVYGSRDSKGLSKDGSEDIGENHLLDRGSTVGPDGGKGVRGVRSGDQAPIRRSQGRTSGRSSTFPDTASVSCPTSGPEDVEWSVTHGHRCDDISSYDAPLQPLRQYCVTREGG